MEYLYTIIKKFGLIEVNDTYVFAKPNAYKNINTGMIGKKCGNRS